MFSATGQLSKDARGDIFRATIDMNIFRTLNLESFQFLFFKFTRSLKKSDGQLQSLSGCLKLH